MDEVNAKLNRINQVLELVHLPKGRRAMGNKWVDTNKRLADEK